MSQLNLTTEEIREITGKSHRAKQAIVLSILGIPFKIRPDGNILVSRDAYKEAMGCKNTPVDTNIVEPDFRAIS